MHKLVCIKFQTHALHTKQRATSKQSVIFQEKMLSCLEQDSNPQPQAYKNGALPTNPPMQHSRQPGKALQYVCKSDTQ